MRPFRFPTRYSKPVRTFFKLADSPADRHIVQIFTQDEKHLVTTILAIRTTGYSRRARPNSLSGKHLPASLALCAPGFILAIIWSGVCLFGDDVLADIREQQ